jgi:hypothetical protein
MKYSRIRTALEYQLGTAPSIRRITAMENNGAQMISPSETLLGKSQLPSQFFKGIHMTYALDATMV